jgi:RNA polymerase sigma factor (TIGR02999 family)
MSDAPVDTLASTLNAAAGGDQQAAEQLLPLVYEELRRLARARLARLPPGNTLQATALVHEAYMRLAGNRDQQWAGKRHFFAAAARAMRHILVDQARRKRSLKRGGEAQRMDLDELDLAVAPVPDDIEALDEALTALEQRDPRKAQVVMLHYFSGLTLEETAAALGVSVATVQREWRFSRALLFTQLREAP